jgi:hypothetical protein
MVTSIVELVSDRSLRGAYYKGGLKKYTGKHRHIFNSGLWYHYTLKDHADGVEILRVIGLDCRFMQRLEE